MGAAGVRGASLREGILRFLDRVDPAICNRGLDCFRKGRVVSLTREGLLVTAAVSGSGAEPYQVELEFGADGDLAEYLCGCPYSWGPVCKHETAVLLALLEREEREEVIPPPAKASPLLQALVEDAGREELEALILERCRTDASFRQDVRNRLRLKGPEGAARLAAGIKDAIRANIRQGSIGEDGCDSICRSLDEALDEVRRQIAEERYQEALTLTCFLLRAGLYADGRLDGESASLRWTMAACLETAGLAAKALAESGLEREAFAETLLQAAEDPLWKGREAWRYELLRRSAVLATVRNEGDFYDLLDRLRAGWQEDGEGAYFEEERLVRDHVLLAARGEEAASLFMGRREAQ